MARPRRSENKREELLKLGCEMLSRNGYSGTGLKQVLDQAKVPKGSFYNYFESKEHFASEIVSRYMEDYLALFSAHCSASESSPLETIRHWYQLLIAKIRQDNYACGCLVGSLAGEIAGDIEQPRLAMAAAYKRWQTMFAEVIARGQSQGEIRDDMAATALVDMFWNQWQGALLRMQFERSVAPLENALVLILDDMFQARTE